MASALSPLVLLSLGIFSTVLGDGDVVYCPNGYYQSAGAFYGKTPQLAKSSIYLGDTWKPIPLNEYNHLVGQPQITGINVFICNTDADEPKDLKLTYKNGYLIAEKPSRWTYTNLYIEYVSLPGPYKPLQRFGLLLNKGAISAKE